MEEEKIPVLEMEERLEKDVGGAYKKALVEQLASHLTELKRALDSGLPPDDFQAARRLKDAVEAASVVVEKVWEGMHS